MLEQWTLYRRASEEINGYLMEGRYSVSRLHLLNGSLEAVKQQVESLEVRKLGGPLDFDKVAHPEKTVYSAELIQQLLKIFVEDEM